MGNGYEMEYKPDPVNAAVYARLYSKYSDAGSFVEKYSKQP